MLLWLVKSPPIALSTKEARDWGDSLPGKSSPEMGEGWDGNSRGSPRVNSLWNVGPGVLFAELQGSRRLSWAAAIVLSSSRGLLL